MQTGQEKFGMQTLNQSLATLYLSKQITLETALTALVEPGRAAGDDQRGTGVVPGAGLGRTRRRRRRWRGSSRATRSAR